MSFELDRIDGSGVYDISRAEWRRENVLPCNFIAQPETEQELSERLCAAAAAAYRARHLAAWLQQLYEMESGNDRL